MRCNTCPLPARSEPEGDSDSDLDLVWAGEQVRGRRKMRVSEMLGGPSRRTRAHARAMEGPVHEHQGMRCLDLKKF